MLSLMVSRCMLNNLVLLTIVLWLDPELASLWHSTMQYMDLGYHTSPFATATSCLLPTRFGGFQGARISPSKPLSTIWSSACLVSIILCKKVHTLPTWCHFVWVAFWYLVVIMYLCKKKLRFYYISTFISNAYLSLAACIAAVHYTFSRIWVSTNNFDTFQNSE